jgi:hypothetical protein
VDLGHHLNFGRGRGLERSEVGHRTQELNSRELASNLALAAGGLLKTWHSAESNGADITRVPCVGTRIPRTPTSLLSEGGASKHGSSHIGAGEGEDAARGTLLKREAARKEV